MLQSEEARNAQRQAEAALSKTRQRNEQLIAEVHRQAAEATEHHRFAERHEEQLASVMDQVRDLRRERDALARQTALLKGKLKARRHRGHEVARPDRS